MGYCSKEYLKHDFNIPEEVILENMLTEELFGLYLSGIISEGKFIEVTKMSHDDFLKMRKQVLDIIGEYGKERDKLIALDIW
jgi:hypothetical protein